jgi:iron-sulfur cluster assembly protein
MPSRQPWPITRRSTENKHGSHLERQGGKHVANFLTKRGKGIGLRLGVRTSGCSGMAYKLDLSTRCCDDVVFESNGVKVIVDPKSCLTSTAPNWIRREGLNEGFKFNNPNVKDQCGCGESSTSDGFQGRSLHALFGLKRPSGLT